MITLLENNEIDTAIKYFIHKTKSNIPENILLRTQRKDAMSRFIDGIRKEFVENKEDPGKAIYYFLMNNDQKRHLQHHFETICEHEIEFLLPFFDANFLEKTYSTPIREMLYHRVYCKWFDFFPASSRCVPWQTYPEHIPCPVELPEGLSNQWSTTRKISLNTRWFDVKSYLSIKNKDNIHLVMDRNKLMIATVLHILFVKDYSHIFRKIRRLK